VILVDTSIWVDHLRRGDDALAALLDAAQVLTHPFVIGEIAMGHLRRRAVVLGDLQDLPRAVAATDAEVLHFIERQGLAGLGLGYIDAHLLASVQLTPGASLWTRDKRLGDAARRMGL
jgi:predicted nucleic acid-binding protein